MTVRVVDVDGRPLARAFTELVIQGAGTQSALDDDGFVDFGTVPAHTDFEVRASLEGYRPAAKAPSGQAGGGVLFVESSLPVAGGQVGEGKARRQARFEVVLQHLEPLRGRVVDAEGRAINRFKLDGRWTDSPTGRFVYAYSWPTFEPSNIGFELAIDGVPPALQSVSAGTTDIGDVVLAPHQPLAVTVLDEGGVPLKGVAVMQTDAVRSLAIPSERRLISATRGSWYGAP